MTTLGLTKKVSKLIKVSPKDISPLGIKDKYSVAYQYIIVKKTKLTEIDKLSGEDIFLVGFLSPYLTSEEIHKGNLFRIDVKIYHKDVDYIFHYIESLLETHMVFPNYYGYQRFGKNRDNHILGLYLLKEEHDKFIETILGERYTANGKLEEKIKRLYNKVKTKEIIKSIDKWYKYFFANALQAYIFNRVLTRRILDEYPINRCIAGDYCMHNNEVRYVRYEEGGRPLIPLLGYSFREKEGYIGNVIKNILRELDISPRDFYNNNIGIKIYGGFRPMDISFIKYPREYKLSRDKIRFSLGLERGGYATIFLRELLKPLNPSNQGY